MFGNIFCEDIFPNIQFKPLLVQLEAFSSGPVIVTWEKRPTPPGYSSLQIVVEKFLPNLLFSWLNTPSATPHITALLKQSGLYSHIFKSMFYKIQPNGLN